MGRATVQALIGLLVASVLFGAAASPVDDLFEVVPERVEAHEFIEAPPAIKKAAAAKPAVKKKSMAKPTKQQKKAVKAAMVKEAKQLKTKATKPKPMTCLQRKQEALRTLMNYNAAKTLGDAASAFAVEDTASKWRLSEWRKRYVAAAADYAFFCEQSKLAMNKITTTVHRQEATEAKKAALKGLQQATSKRQEKHQKKSVERSTKRTEAQTKAREDKQKKLIKRTAEEARLVRLRSYPQDALDMEGFVADAETGQGVGEADIHVKCPFKTYTGKTGTGTKRTFAKYLIRKAVSGPDGYRCFASFSKPGYISLKYDVLIEKRDTPALFRTAMLMPKKSVHVPFRVVLQYGNIPADVDSHLFIMSPSPATHKPVNVGEHFDGSAAFSYDPDGKKLAFPFMTMDAKCNSGYGPETHTIHKTLPTKYGYYVKNQDHHITDNGHFHNSEARVFLYQGSKLTHSFAIRNAQGTPSAYWQVFSIDCTGKGATKPGGVCKVLPIDAFVKGQPSSSAPGTKTA